MFRFSLRTLVLVALWCGAAMGFWARREPWTLAQKTFCDHAPEGNWYYLQVRETRQAVIENRTSLPNALSRVLITEVPSGRSVHSFNVGDSISGIRFNSVDEIEVLIRQFVLKYTRNYPEAWWGHCNRPEVWLLFILTLGLVVTFVRHVRKVRRVS